MSAYTQDDLDTLKQALLRGENSVTFADGRRVDYKSQDDVLRAIEFVRRDLAEESGRTRLLAEYSKGVEC